MSGTIAPAIDDRLATLDRRVEHLENLMTMALAEPLREIREQAGIGDGVDAAILRLTTDWSAASEIKEKVYTLTGAADSTVRERFKKLVDAGALEARGNTHSREYRNTFLLG